MFYRYLSKVVMRFALAAVMVAGATAGSRSALVSGDGHASVPSLSGSSQMQEFTVLEEPWLLLASGEGGGSDESSHLRPQGGGGSDGVDDRTTQTVIRLIQSGTSECSSLPPEYRADCLAQVYRDAAASLRGPGYAGARRDLNNAARRIDRVVRRNLDRSQPPIRRGGKVIRPVRKEAVAQVNQEVRQIVADTEKRLIRSAGRSAKRKSHYQRIAQAVGTGKTILRS